jgi:hypothetical protein
MKKQELFLYIFILILLAFVWIYFIYNLKNKQIKDIIIKKEKVQNEIKILSNKSIYIPKQINTSNYESLLNFIKKYNLAEIDQVKNINNNISINFSSDGQKFLNILNYIYQNEDFLQIDSLNLYSNSNLLTDNYLLVDLVLHNLYTPPTKEDLVNYSFNLIFFNEKYYIDKIKRQIQEKKKYETLKKLKETQEKLQLYANQNIYQQKLNNINNNINLNIVYKGVIFINNEKYAALSINEKEYFLKENQTISIDQNNIKIIEIQKQSVKLKINDNILEFNLDIF